MAPTRRTVQGLAEAEHLPPEEALAAAIIRQVLVDTRSPRREVREDAQAFLTDASQVGFWAEALGLDQTSLLQGLRAALRQGH
jgi:hypothetical protein